MKIRNEIDILKRALKKDKDYRMGWQANIAMAFFDEVLRNKVKVSRKNLHTISNNAANNFLNLLCK